MKEGGREREKEGKERKKVCVREPEEWKGGEGRGGEGTGQGERKQLGLWFLNRCAIDIQIRGGGAVLCIVGV